MMERETLPEVTDEFKQAFKTFKREWYKKYKDISKEATPQVDGDGKKIIERRLDGYDYITEAYMRDCLDRHFPGWSWEAACPLHFLGSEWVVAQGHLVIIDEYLARLGINPPFRKFFGVDSVRIQYKKDSVHEPGNIIDVGDNAKQANTAALKYAINRLCHIGDDVYGKRIEEEGAGSYADIFEAKPDAENFAKVLRERGISFTKAFKILEVEGLNEIKDYKEALAKVLEGKE